MISALVEGLLTLLACLGWIILLGDIVRLIDPGSFW